MTHHIDFEPVGRRGECPEGNTLLDCARHLGVNLVNLCGGTGGCGRCIVQILEGEVSQPRPGEGEFLSAEKLAAGYRLACRAVTLSDCKVRVPPESLSTPQRTQIEGEEVLVTPEPLVETYSVSLMPPSLEDLRADVERLHAALEERHGLVAASLDPVVMRTLPSLLRSEDWQADVAVRDGQIVALLPPATRPLGLAVDLGTTKIAAYLMDLASGETLASAGAMNPQIAYGEDVIARISFADESPKQAAQLQHLVAGRLNELARDLCRQTGTDSAHILEMVLVGNTAMHHLFLLLDAEYLARAPYVAAVSSAQDVKARDLGLELAPGATVHLLPNIAGYVGADHVAMLLASGMACAQGVVLALDIGTNTEVCLANHGRLTSLSCASGPAFEGAHIRHGMRAAVGAIEHVRLVDGNVEYQTIGDTPPVGLCGSGILDTLAQLHLAGVVDRRGRMKADHERVQGEKGDREFLLAAMEGADDTPITFTQKDVRELQLAKGAMRCGVDVLLEANGLTAADVDQVLIAGAFGTYIDVSSAMTIGMLPSMPLERVRQVGNAAGMGAKMALISRGKRAEAQELAGRIGYLELATWPGFAMAFAEATYLGESS
jgi:uncharacterized 2Fe-2S/4Fe-4S cluster protein (DUF4445 family)